MLKGFLICCKISRALTFLDQECRFNFPLLKKRQFYTCGFLICKWDIFITFQTNVTSFYWWESSEKLNLVWRTTTKNIVWNSTKGFFCYFNFFRLCVFFRTFKCRALVRCPCCVEYCKFKESNNRLAVIVVDVHNFSLDFF